METELFQNLAIALGLGLLVGLQREWSGHEGAGVRTFPLITVFGTLCAMLGTELGTWVLPAGLIAVAMTLGLADLARLRGERVAPGTTTDMAALVMYSLGAALGQGYRLVPVVVAGCVAVLLHWKKPLHHFVRKMGADDLRAVIRLVIVGLIILPLLPNRAYGPYHVLNPFQICLMVALIMGISLAAYVGYKLLGREVGPLLAGVLGGLISSTATAFVYARRSSRGGGAGSLAVVVILLSSATVFGRVIFEIAVVTPEILAETAPPILAVMLFMFAVSLGCLLSMHRRLPPPEDEEAPSDLRGALVFGLLYAAVILGAAFANEHAGTRSLYLVAGLSGLTDVDAITLSTAQMVRSGLIETALGWRLILVGAMANLVFKAGVLAVLAPPYVFRGVAFAFGSSLAFGAVLLIFG